MSTGARLPMMESMVGMPAESKVAGLPSGLPPQNPRPHLTLRPGTVARHSEGGVSEGGAASRPSTSMSTSMSTTQVARHKYDDGSGDPASLIAQFEYGRAWQILAYCSPRHTSRMPYDSRNEGSKCVG